MGRIHAFCCKTGYVANMRFLSHSDFSQILLGYLFKKLVAGNSGLDPPPSRARKNLEAAPRIIFAVRGGPQNNFRRFHSFLPFRRFTSVFCRFSPLSLFFRRFSSFFTVFNRFSQFFFILFHRLFTVFSIAFHGFFPRIFWIPPFARIEWVQNLKVRGSRHSILAKMQNPQILDSACSQDRMGAAPKGPPFLTR